MSRVSVAAGASGPAAAAAQADVLTELRQQEVQQQQQRRQRSGSARPTGGSRLTDPTVQVLGSQVHDGRLGTSPAGIGRGGC